MHLLAPSGEVGEGGAPPPFVGEGRVEAISWTHTSCTAAKSIEDFSDIPIALDAPYTYWGLGGVRTRTLVVAALAHLT